MSFDRSALTVQAEAAAALVANYRDILNGDEDAKLDLIEGETELNEAIAAGVHRLQELEALIEGAKNYERALKARRDRLNSQRELIRTAIGAAMAQADVKSLETPTGTISRKRVPPKLILDETRQGEIPADYWIMEPKLNKTLLLADVKSGKDVPGATLSNGSETIQVRGA